MRIRQQKWQQDKTSLLRQAADEARELLSSTTRKAEAEATEIKQKAQASLDAQLETHARQITRVEQREQLINEQLAGFVRQEKMLQSSKSSFRNGRRNSRNRSNYFHRFRPSDRENSNRSAK